MEKIIYQDSQRFKRETDDLALLAGKVGLAWLNSPLS